jgi:lipopolysaccharide export LptBFGC system permease protein LptF
MKTSPIKELFVATSETHNDWRNIAISLKSMTPDEQLNELVNQRPELRSAVEASRHFWPRVFTRLAAIASVVIVVILASALGLITVRFAVLFCIVIFAALVGFAIALLVSGKVTFYSAKSTRN